RETFGVSQDQPTPDRPYVFVACFLHEFGADFSCATDEDTAYKQAGATIAAWVDDFPEKQRKQLVKLLKAGEFKTAVQFYTKYHPKGEKITVDSVDVSTPDDEFDFDFSQLED